MVVTISGLLTRWSGFHELAQSSAQCNQGDKPKIKISDLFKTDTRYLILAYIEGLASLTGFIFDFQPEAYKSECMWKPVGLVIIALASSTAVAPLFLSFAKSEPALLGAKFAQSPPRHPSFRQLGQSAPVLNAKQQGARSRLAWRNGHWRHGARGGRIGWWWDVGGVWYFYPEPIDGPPDYVSDVAVDDETAVPSQPPQPTKPSPQTFYYSPGSLTGTGYPTVEDCWQARDRAGGVGVCVIK